MHGWLRAALPVLSAVLFLLLLPGPAALAETRIMVVSDTHYLAPRLYEDSGLFLRVLREGDGKYTQRGEELMEALLLTAQALRPDALVLTGDLSFNGERESHEALAEWLSRIEALGVPVYVMPGNHDINVPNSARFLPDAALRVPSVTPEEFSRIYAPFLLPQEGGKNANLSYHVKVNGQVWLALADLAVYRDAAQVFGVCTADHLDWLEGVLREARDAGARVITFTHHNVIPHTEFSKDSFVAFGSGQLCALLQAYGVRLNLSGHIHAQHIVRQNGLTDAASGAFSMTPHRYILVTVSDDGTLSYEARALDDAFLPEGFQADSREWFLSISREKTEKSLSSLHLPEGELTQMLDYAARFHLSYFEGIFSSRDPSWQLDPAFALWSRPETEAMFRPTIQLQREENGGELAFVIDPD